MRNLLIIGAGGHGKVIAETALLLKKWEQIAFLDDSYPQRQNLNQWQILGTTKDAQMLLSDFPETIIAIGNNQLRSELFSFTQNLGFNLVNILHPTAVVSPSVKLGNGTVVLATAVINADAIIGANCIINTGVIVEHDCQLGGHVHLASNVTLGGGVIVEERVWIGVGASVVGKTKIAAGAIVPAGSSIA